MAGWQSGHAAACKAVYAGSIPTSASIAKFEKAPLRRFFFAWNLDGKFASHHGLGVTSKPAEAGRCVSGGCAYLTIVFLHPSKKSHFFARHPGEGRDRVPLRQVSRWIPAFAGMTSR